jgi:hypothetical protein
MSDKPPDFNLKDILGIEPVAHAIDSSVEGIGKFLGRIVNPSADEIGLILEDQFKWIRTKNAINIARKTDKLLIGQGGIGAKRTPLRIAMRVLQEGSWIDNDDLQDMWAGLLASSCTESGTDDSNLIFITLLSQLTSAGAAILNHLCDTAQKYLLAEQFPQAESLLIEAQILKRVSGVTDIHRLNAEIAHLHSMGLLVGANDFTYDDQAYLRVSPLGLQMYVRCQGFNGPPGTFFGLADIVENSESDT